ncbi:ChrR family anti-sigma-E factor [Variovorax sp. OV329]|uniref:ChrR family anti-sigma-E factor n=1 Tax=Variovorax sp. OV329 TaxID=1882825 RepID=UPI0008F2ABE7|nr:ChrR family anti-sigma-E factor [Variovorax sp. OV329]SFN41618.1 anti-ECFsigma factor, ChrR [Variovorax sp. OV329]
MIRHHPDDALMLAHAAGTLGAGHRLLLDVHLEGCAHCRERLQRLDALGGVLLDQLAPAELAPDALERTLARIDAPQPQAAALAQGAKPQLPTAWPRAMAGCNVSRWRWMGPGMYWNRVTLPDADDANVFMLRIGAGRMLPQHTHSNSELTQVLYGAFDDGRSAFAEGDFDETDAAIRHQPVVNTGGECICLASVEGKVLFEGWLARTMGAMIGM